MPGVYDDVFEAWRMEIRSAELQPLKADFYKTLAGHMRQLRESQRNLDPKSLKAGIIEEEESRLRQLVKELVNKRLEKMIAASRKNQQVIVATPEQWVLEKLLDVSRQMERFESDITQGSEPSASPEEPKNNLLVRFVKDVPAIMGVDLRTHGPFLKEDVADLPYENAVSLIRQGAAIEIRAPLASYAKA